MDQNQSLERPLRIIAAEERPHPAMLKLARACIELAHLEKQPPTDVVLSAPHGGEDPPASAVEVSS